MKRAAWACAGAVLLAGCVALRLEHRAPALLPAPETSARAPEVTALLARGPAVMRVTADGATLMGRPVNALTNEAVTVTVTPGGGAAIAQSGRYDRDLDSFRLRFEGLPANTLCRYTVTLAGRTIGPFHFATAIAPGAPTPFRMGVYGDTRSNWGAHQSIVGRMFAEQPRLVLNTGDLVGNGDVPAAWDLEYFGPARELLAHAPVFPAHGNHEQSGARMLKLFDLPQFWYSVDCGCVRILTLASYKPWEPGTEQYAWLQRELARPWDGWLFVQMHAPPFNVMQRTPHYTWINTIFPLLLDKGVDLIFAGHEHNYIRTRPIALEPGPRGAVQIISAGGGAQPYGFIKDLPFIAYGKTTWHYVILDITPRRITGRAVAPEGDVLDRFVIDREAPQPDLMLAPRSTNEQWRAAFPAH